MLLVVFDLICKRIYSNKKNSYKRSWLVILSITLHNIPEGLIVGVAFGSVVNGLGDYGIIEALLLTLSIAIQNFPEGCSISLPLKRDGYSHKKAFLIGQSSALVEPISAVLGALLVMKIQLILPFLLAFVAGPDFVLVDLYSGPACPPSALVPGSCLITGLVDDSNRYNFVRFEDPRIVQLFEGLDWVVDYKSFRGQDDEFFADAYNEVVAEMKSIEETYEGMFEFERKDHQDMLWIL